MSLNEELPNDLAACHARIEELQRLDQQHDEIVERLAQDNQLLRFELEQLKRYLFGRRSERHVPESGQLPLFDKQPAATETAAVDTTAEIEQQITYRRRVRSKADRFPEHLSREQQTIDVPEAERQCPCCGEEMPVIDTDCRERLEYVPSKIVVHDLHYLKRACGKCKTGVTVAPPPAADEAGASLTPGSRYGFGVTAQIILGKYADHLPLYRLEDVFARAGVVIPRSTQVGLLDAAADLVEPLVARMQERLLASGVIGLDDTPVRLQDASKPGAMRTARMWLARGREGTPYDVFFFHESRQRDGPEKFLGDYRGHVVVDAYGVNDGVYLGSRGRIVAACCHAHARRKFEAAVGNAPKLAKVALAFYRELYDIEDRGRELSAEARRELRQAKSVPVLARFKGWLEEQKSSGSVLPKSAMGEAVRYALNQWQPLQEFTKHGSLPIDNNDTERDLRRLTIGRKNWLFIGSAAAGVVAARMVTLVASAARHNLDLWAYLNDVLRSLAGGSADLESLLPDRWAAAHPESLRTYRQTEQAARAAQTKATRERRRKLANKR